MISKICNSCGKDCRLSDFYSSSSYFDRYTGKVNVCKKCIFDYVEPKQGNYYDVEKIKSALRMIDRPFILHLWDASSRESEQRSSAAFGIYMKNIVMKDFRDLSWADSVFPTETADLLVRDVLDGEDSNFVHIGATEIRYWGKGYTMPEYEFLEEEKMKLMSSFECPDYGMEMIMKDICFINLEIEKLRLERKDNNQKTLTNLIDTRSKLMNDANMKPIQSTGAEGNDQVTFGTLIRKWENERPIPKPLDDEMKEYIDTYMVGHLAKMEGLNNELTKKYDDAISQYTINHSEISKTSTEWDD